MEIILVLLLAAATAIITGGIGLVFAKLNKKLIKQDKQLVDIHVLVNSRLSKTLEKLAKLEDYLGKEKAEHITGKLS